jgi:hypothetical protein
MTKTTKTTYAVQWFDGDKWRTTFGYRGDTLTQGLSELELHISLCPEVESRLVELETTTIIQKIHLTSPSEA